MRRFAAQGAGLEWIAGPVWTLLPPVCCDVSVTVRNLRAGARDGVWNRRLSHNNRHLKVGQNLETSCLNPTLGLHTQYKPESRFTRSSLPNLGRPTSLRAEQQSRSHSPPPPSLPRWFRGVPRPLLCPGPCHRHGPLCFSRPLRRQSAPCCRAA